jgi:hypothetical protein
LHRSGWRARIASRYYDRQRDQIWMKLPTLFRFSAFAGVVLLAVSTLPLQAKNSQGKKVHLHGTLIDMTCWNDRSGDAQKLLREHTKRCLQMPDCIRSGYAVVTPDGKVYQMDPASNRTTTQWIAATSHDANWRVDVKGRVQNGLLDVSKLQLEK